MLHLVRSPNTEVEEPKVVNRNEDGEFVRHFRAADAGLSAAWKWLLVGVQVVTAGVLGGIYIANSRNTADKVSELNATMKNVIERIDTVMLEQNTQKLKLQMLTDSVAKLELSQTQLQQQLNTMRDMREAYVYAQSMRQAAPTPKRAVAP